MYRNRTSNNMIPYGQHYIDEDDIDKVVEVLRSGTLTQGPVIYEFETTLAKQVEAKYAVAVSSGTAALHLACLAAGIGPGKKVYTSANTFVASANSVIYTGGEPRFTDINVDTLNMCPESLLSHIAKDPEIDAVIPVHFAGLPCDMEAISNIASKHNAKVIEDASHALGAYYSSGKPVGCCAYSEMTVFSLHPVKGVTAGEGGVITTNDSAIYSKLLHLRSHGISKGNFDIPGISEGDDALVYKDEAIDNGKLNPWYYEMQELGYNYRITDFQCALALSQLQKINKFMQRRKEIAKIYDSELANLPFVTLTQADACSNSSLHLYVIRIDFNKLGKTRGEVMRELFEKNIGTQVHYIPVPFHPYYADMGFERDNYPVTKNYYYQALSIPIYYELTDSMVADVVSGIKDTLR
ncbi:MAG: perosamine synthetase [Enterobacterales bacterium]|jgi:perosamine synthetase